MHLQEGCGLGRGVLLRLRYLQAGYIKVLNICRLGGIILLRQKYLQGEYIKFLNICGLGASYILDENAFAVKAIGNNFINDVIDFITVA